MELSNSQKRVIATARNAFKDGVKSAFQLHGNLGPSPRAISSMNPSTNIRRYWNRTGSYIRNSMDTHKPFVEKRRDTAQGDLFNNANDAQTNPHHEPTGSHFGG